MIIKVRFKDLDEAKNSFKSNSDLLNDEINKMMEQLQVLQEVWNGGEASRNFNIKVSNYLNYLKKIPNIYNKMSNVMETMNKNYQILDSDYAESLKKAVIEHE